MTWSLTSQQSHSLPLSLFQAVLPFCFFRTKRVTSSSLGDTSFLHGVTSSEGRRLMSLIIFYTERTCADLCYTHSKTGKYYKLMCFGFFFCLVALRRKQNCPVCDLITFGGIQPRYKAWSRCFCGGTTHVWVSLWASGVINIPLNCSSGLLKHSKERESGVLVTAGLYPDKLIIHPPDLPGSFARTRACDAVHDL